jgi:hypothetical protein
MEFAIESNRYEVKQMMIRSHVGKLFEENEFT